MKHFPPPSIHWRTAPKSWAAPSSTTAQRAIHRPAGLAPPPTQFGPPAIQRLTPPAGRQVLQPAGLCSCLGKLFSCCLPGYQRVDDDNVELIDDRGTLPPWGTATFLGYHWTGAWTQIKQNGFKAGGGMLGQGVYLCIKDHRWVSMTYTKLTTLLEVGYVGDMSQWARVEIKSVMSFMSRDDRDDFDVIKTENDEGPLNQICYRTDGPSHINIGNFRVRLVR